MNSQELNAPISIPNPKRAAIFDFLESDSNNDSGYLFENSSPPLTGRGRISSKDGPLLVGGNREKAHTPDSTAEFQRLSSSTKKQQTSFPHNEGSVGWSGLDLLGVKDTAGGEVGLPAVPSLSSLASPWAPQSNHPSALDLSFDSSAPSRGKSGFGGVLTSSVGLDLQWTLTGTDLSVPLTASRAPSAIGILPPDVPLNTPQPISRPVSAMPIHDSIMPTNLSSLLGTDSVFQRTITPPVPSSGTRSISPRPTGLTILPSASLPSNTLEESRWPKPVRFAYNHSNPNHRNSLLDTPNHGSNHNLDGLLGSITNTTPIMLRPSSSSSAIFSPGASLSANNAIIGATADHGSINGIMSRGGRDSIGSPFPTTPGLSLVQSELPLEALEQYRQSRESTPQIGAFPNLHHHQIIGSHHSPPPYAHHNPHHNHHHQQQQHQNNQYSAPNAYTSRSPQPHSQSQHQQNMSSQQLNNNQNNKSGFSSLDDRAVENVIVGNCHQILLDAAEHMLKAVELANTLRARVGTEVLAQVRERWGGLLSLLEKHKDRFLVERIPKNDRVRLVDVLGAASTATLANVTNDSATTEVADSGDIGNTNSRKVSAEKDEAEVIDFNAVLETIQDVNNAEGYDGHGNSHNSHHNHTASRCLHVGNVPNTYTDIQLTKEFDRFGVIEGLKLINQKNGQRRFAFITFQTIEQAIAARHALSKVHPWKSAISFAHKDLLRNGGVANLGNPVAASSGSTSAYHAGTGYPQQQQSSRPSTASHAFTQYNYQQNSSHTNQQGFQNNQYNLYGVPSEHPDNSSGGYNNFNNNNSRSHSGSSNNIYSQPRGQYASKSQQHQQQQKSSLPSNGWTNPTICNVSNGQGYGVVRTTMNNSITGGNSMNHNTMMNTSRHSPPAAPMMMRVGFDSVPVANTPSYQGGIEATHGQTRERIILQRLCDDTYVPTQPWPIDREADMMVGQSIIDQILQFGGNTTISKLRGFLKHRMGTVDNIKSVPLKAMLLAYPQYFHVENNYVSVVGNNNASTYAGSLVGRQGQQSSQQVVESEIPAIATDEEES